MFYKLKFIKHVFIDQSNFPDLGDKCTKPGTKIKVRYVLDGHNYCIIYLVNLQFVHL